MIAFEYPHLLWLIFLPFVIRFLFPYAKGMYGAPIKVPFIQDFKKLKTVKGHFLTTSAAPQNFSLKFLLLFFAFFLVVISLMRPVKISDPIRLQNKGRDILLVTDISTSMLEEDFIYQNRRITRLEAVRAVVSDFVQKRFNDRLGLILFGTNAYLQAPLTFDRQAVLDILSSMKAGMAGQSTAIGDALGLALKTLKKDNTPDTGKVIILLTDGENNDGSMTLPQAIDLAKKENVKVYTVGVGADFLSIGLGFFNIKQENSLDEKSLQSLADETKGQYFRVKNLSDLVAVYQKINQLEEQNFNDSFIYPKTELYYLPLAAALILVIFALSFEIFLNRRRRS